MVVNISEYLVRYGIQMDQTVIERNRQSGKKPVLCMLGMLGLLSTIIRGRERSDPKNASHGKIPLVNEHNLALTMSTSVSGVARISARCFGNLARASRTGLHIYESQNRQSILISKVENNIYGF